MNPNAHRTSSPAPTLLRPAARRRPLGAGLAVAVLTTVTLAGSASAGTVETTQTPPTAHDRAAIGAPTVKLDKALAANEELRTQDAKFDRLVGAADGGSYVNDAGELVVLTTTRSAAAAVRAHGGQARVVENTEKHLTGIVDKLNAFSADHATGSIQSWGVDTIANEVTVTRTAGGNDAATTAFLVRARALGDVNVTTAPAAEAPQATDNMYGGLQYIFNLTSTGYQTCSFGFNALDSSNRYVNVTAGHCLQTRPLVSRFVGSTAYQIGSTRSFSFPGRDYGVFNNSYPSYWGPVASVWNYAGSSIAVRGSWGNPPVGATVCKSGRTTGYTCGTITALNQTVVYDGTKTVYGLTRHNACVQGGDSGGANISSGGYALGITSGASMTSSGLCLSKAGGQNVSWYQPIVPALNANGLRLLVTP